MRKSILKIAMIAIALSSLSFIYMSCAEDELIADTESSTDTDSDGTSTETTTDANFVPTDWTSETHSKDAAPNFTEVFNDKAVKRLDIKLSDTNWKSMLANMTSLYGTFGTRAGGNGLADAADPIKVPADVFYNGKQWYKVGVRFKGNSSLQSTWQSGNMKLSFKLDFDEYEDEYPQIKNQRFYGFKKFSLKNNYDDQSFLREKVAGDVFRKAGLAGSHTAFYTVYVDYGSGPIYFGLYTLTEEVDNTVIKTQFTNDSGNLYKPEDYGANFANGTFNQDGFEKKTNEDEADWSDIKSLFSALHATTRTTDPAAWRTNLDAILDTDSYLKYLAVNTVIQNWDTYGRMTHNYYLYNNPANNKLTWIPWDNNEALQSGKMGGALNLDFSNLSGTWPMISYLYADSVYKAKYNAYVKETVEK